jgi:hypothetical protein
MSEGKLETIARTRKALREEKAEVLADFRGRAEALDDAEDRVLAELDEARHTAPPLVVIMAERTCPLCAEVFKVSAWDGDHCPGCGKASSNGN